MSDTPTDPAPRGADAPLPCAWCGSAVAPVQRETDGSKWGALACAECGAVAPEVRTGYGKPETWYADALAEWNKRSPVPAEATSGAERQEVVAWNAMVDVLNEVAPGWADDWDGSTTIDAAVKAIRALRTPPAPLPREGATAGLIEAIEALRLPLKGIPSDSIRRTRNETLDEVVRVIRGSHVSRDTDRINWLERECQRTSVGIDSWVDALSAHTPPGSIFAVVREVEGDVHGHSLRAAIDAAALTPAAPTTTKETR